MSTAYVVLGAITIMLIGIPGALKLAGHQRMREGAEHLGIPWSRFRLIGVLEATAVVGIAIGFAWRPLGVAAGIGVVALMVGALSFHARARDKFADMMGAALVLACAAAYVVVGIVS